MSDDNTRMILAAITTLTGKVEHMDARFGMIERKVDRIETKVDRLHDDVQDVKLRLHGIETSFAA